MTPDLFFELDRGISAGGLQRQTSPHQRRPGPDWDDPILQAIDPKVVRIVQRATTMVDGHHDFGGELQFRGGEHVVLGGTEGNDRLIGDRGIDTLWGDGGDDYLNAA